MANLIEKGAAHINFSNWDVDKKVLILNTAVKLLTKYRLNNPNNQIYKLKEDF